jgi:hypothetical protein
MRMLKLCAPLVALGFLLTCAPPVRAIPVFERKYGLMCMNCHSGYPRLNDYGVRFRQNGYQLPGRENDEKTVFEGPAPFAARASTGYNYDKFNHVKDAEDVNQFQLNGLDLLSGGLFKRNVGYLMIYPPEIRGSRGVVAQPGTLEMANVVFSNLGSSWLNLRIGRFEPAYVAFSVKREFSFSPIEIYDFAFPGGSPFSDTQTGIELYGYDYTGLKYAVGWINGSETNGGDAPSDLYLRLSKVFGQGEGQTAGQRVGVVGYFGQAKPDLMFSTNSQKGFYRLGADASLNFRQWNLALQYLIGKDDKELWDTSSDVEFSGGFAELSYWPAFDLVAFARYDLVNPDEVTGIEEVTRLTLGARYYIEDNIAVHVEYSSSRQNLVGDPTQTEDFFTARLDFAF